MDQEISRPNRREFLQQTTMAGASIILSAPSHFFSTSKKRQVMATNIKSKGYAGHDKTSKLVAWNFERRSVGDDDILIDLKFCGVCHSDIHQIRGHWGDQTYPQVPGHEIAGIVSAIGKNVTKFKVGDKAGVGCMVDSCMTCTSCRNGEEHHCENHATLFTYGNPVKTSPTGITQGGYSNNIVVKEHFAIKIPENISLQNAAPLLCAGITTYSPLTRAHFQKGDKVGVAGIGGLGHLAVKLAVNKGAEVYAFTTSESKVSDIRRFGAKHVVVVDSVEKLKPYNKSLDYMISTIPVNYNVAAYASLVKPYGNYTQVGMPVKGEVTINNFAMNRNRVRYSTSLIGGIPQTQEVIDYCAQNKICPEVQVIKASETNDTWEKVVYKEAR